MIVLKERASYFVVRLYIFNLGVVEVLYQSFCGKTNVQVKPVEHLTLTRNNLGNNKDQEDKNSQGQQSDNAKEFNSEFVDNFFRRFLYTSQLHKRNRCTILFCCDSFAHGVPVISKTLFL